MLIKQQILVKIRLGEVTLAYRMWKKPSVKKGSLIKTSIGLVSIVDISQTTLDKIKEADAVKAGYKNKQTLLTELNGRPEGIVYKIRLGYHSEDPRIGLRQDDKVSKEDLEVIREKLARLDKYSKVGDWTIQMLEAIKSNAGLRAGDLALKAKKEKDWLKVNVRKLKELGLTISLEPGYKLSPRGQAVLKKLNK